MMRRSVLIAFVCFVLIGPVALLAQDTGQSPNSAAMQAVLAAFPKNFQYPGEPPTYDQTNPSDHNRTCAVVYSQDGDGSPDLIAAIYNGKRSEIAMLAYQQGTVRVVDAVTDRRLFLGGEFCSIDIVNLADPANPSSPLAKTIVVSFPSGRGPIGDFYFLWNGQKFVDITPLYREFGPKGVAETAITNATVVDVNHRGPMQIIGSNTDSDRFPQEDGIASTGTRTLYRFNGHIYKPIKTLLFFGQFTPQPLNWNESMDGPYAEGNIDPIDMHHRPAPSYRLRIINGNRNGGDRAKSVKVEINGVVVVLPYEINQNVETLTRRVQLQKKNLIKVIVDGPPKSYVYVMIEDAPFISSTPRPLMGERAIYTTKSSLTYDPISKTFNGTLTITNEGDRTITGPVNVVLNSLAYGVTLANATGSYGKWPYIVIPKTQSLAPGQSASVKVRFSNPNGAYIDYDPEPYSGSMK